MAERRGGELLQGQNNCWKRWERWKQEIRRGTESFRLMTGLLVGAVLVLTTPAAAVIAAPEWPSDTEIRSEEGIVADMDSGAILFGQNIRRRVDPSSLAKLLTALVVAENSGLNETVTFTPRAMMEDPDNGNKLHLAEGDSLTVEDCLYVMLLRSSNQAANALAEHVAGDRETFVARMNQKAEELGCADSNFTNPSGLDDANQYTTAYDMWLISRAVFSNPTLLKIASARSHEIPPTKRNSNRANFRTEHKILDTMDPDSDYYFPYAVAGKVGFSINAGQTLVTYAAKDDRNLICVTLNSRELTHYRDSITLLKFGFDSFKNCKIAENEEMPAAVKELADLENGVYAGSDLHLDPGAVLTLPRDAAFADAQKTLETNLPHAAPGGAVAKLTYTYANRECGSAYIINAKEDSEEENDVDATEVGIEEAVEGPFRREENSATGNAEVHLSIRLTEAAGQVILLVGILTLFT